MYNSVPLSYPVVRERAVTRARTPKSNQLHRVVRHHEDVARLEVAWIETVIVRRL
jgi:hypothetical protein